jgi:hypothetical protein
MIDTYYTGASAQPTITKRAGEKLTYGLDLTDYLAAIGGAIEAVEVVLASGLSKEGDVTFDSNTVTVPKVSGGTAGQELSIEYRVTLQGTGQIVVRTVWLHII